MRLVWLLLLIVPTVFGATINHSETSIVMEDLSASVTTDFTIYSDVKLSNLTLILLDDPSNLEVSINNETKKCSIIESFARCGKLPAGTHTVSYSYDSSYPIANVGENTLFQYTDELPYFANSQVVSLQLPVGYIIPRESGKDEEFYINPKPSEVYSDGQHIILSWQQTGQKLSVSVLTKRLEGYSTGWLAFGALLIVCLVVAIAYSLRKRKSKVKTKKSKSKSKPQKQVIPGLMESEQIVVDLLKKNGEMWQKHILAESGFSKAKLSRVIRNLEERDVLTRTIYGNANKIALKQK